MIRTTYVLAIAMAAMMAVGRVYDERLSFAGLNLSLLLSAAFALVLSLGAGGFLGQTRQVAAESGGTAVGWRYAAPLLLVGAWVAIHTILFSSYSPGYTQEKLITFELITLPSCLLVVRQRSHELVRALVVCFACVGGALILLSLPSILGGITGRTGYGRGAERLSLFGGGPIVYARWVLTAALVVALSPMRVVLKGAVVLVALLAALLAQSKGPVMFFGVSLGFVALLLALVQRKVMRAAVIAAAGVGLVAVAPRVIEAVGLGDRLLTLFDSGQLMQTTSSMARLDLLRVSAEMIRDHPFGVGLGNWSTVASRYVISGSVLSYPHNLFVEVAAELGIVLAVVLGGWIAWCSGRSTRGLVTMVRLGDPRAGLARVVLALFTFYFLNSMVSGDLSDARLMFVALAMLVVITAEPYASTAGPLRLPGAPSPTRA